VKKPKGVFPLAGRFGPHCKATGEFRCPLKGEAYLSGAIIEGWEAPNDLSQKFWIAVLVTLTKCLCCGGSGKVEA
jgi:hypothetical protein